MWQLVAWVLLLRAQWGKVPLLKYPTISSLWHHQGCLNFPWTHEAHESMRRKSYWAVLNGTPHKRTEPGGGWSRPQETSSWRRSYKCPVEGGKCMLKKKKPKTTKQKQKNPQTTVGERVPVMEAVSKKATKPLQERKNWHLEHPSQRKYLHKNKTVLWNSTFIYL